MLVKEVFETATAAMTTGTVSHAQILKGWFVMVKDSKDSHPDNNCGATAGAGLGSTPPTRRKPRRPISRSIVYPVMCRRAHPTGFMFRDTPLCGNDGRYC